MIMKYGMLKIKDSHHVFKVERYNISVRKEKDSVSMVWNTNLNRSVVYVNVVKRIGNVISDSLEKAMDLASLMEEISPIMIIISVILDK
jgi:hypothetical protein